MRKLIINFPFILFISCSHTTKNMEGERRLNEQEVPVFLNSYRDKEHHDFFEKNDNGIKIFEVKFFDKNKQVSIKFDKKGNFLEQEKDIALESLDKATHDRILHFINDNFQNAVILEAEERIDQTQKKFIDIEIRHESSPSGYWELAFTEDGFFCFKEIEENDPIETLN